jgi:hypothetical protein
VSDFEIRPGGGGCGCGGGRGEKRAAPVHPLLGRALEEYEVMPSARLTDDGRVGHRAEASPPHWWASYSLSSMPDEFSGYWIAQASVLNQGERP